MFARTERLTCCLLHVSCWETEWGRVCLSVCVCVCMYVFVCVRVSAGPGPQEQRAYIAQWGQPHQGSPQTAGSLRWCIGLGILIGPSASARGPGVSVCVCACLCVCTHVCFCMCLSLSFFVMQRPRHHVYILFFCVQLAMCGTHLHAAVTFWMCENVLCSGVCVCGSCSPCLFECIPHRALWAGCTSTDLSSDAVSTPSLHTHTVSLS